MAKIRPDFSFQREGRPLSAWLVDLVADEAPTRLKAGRVLQAMTFGVPDTDTDLGDLDWEEFQERPDQADRLREAIRRAVDAPDFPTADFVRRLIVYRIAIDHDWRDRVDQAMAKLREETGERLERLAGRLLAAGDEQARNQASQRFARWLCASLGRDRKAQDEIYAGAEAMTEAGMSATLVFDALDVALLADRPGLQAMIEDDAMFRDAARALERIGPTAVAYAPSLLDQLDKRADGGEYDGERALGSIGREEPGIIDALLRRIGSSSGPVRSGAAVALARAGPPLAGRADAAVECLLEATRGPNADPAVVEALAAVGRDREDALGRVLELAGRRAECEGVSYERGAALHALRHFRGFAGRVVPALVDAFDSFEEYDPDLSNGGEHGRVCESLAAFGTEAAPALPRLLVYLDAWRREPIEDRQRPDDVFGVLGAIGPAASGAIPILEAIRRDDLDDDEPGPLDRAILAIRGAVARPGFFR